MFMRLVSAAALATALQASAATAATYTVTNVLDGSDSGFGFSVFHDQSFSRMNGTIIGDPDATGFLTGVWDSVSGAISFGASLVGVGAGSFTASGILNLNALGAGPVSGVDGWLDITFSGASVADDTYRFYFAEYLMGGNGPPNSYNSDTGHTSHTGEISLWGDLGNYSWSNCNDHSHDRGDDGACIGLDLRLSVQENPAVVPLPAALPMLLTAIGGLFGVRRFRKAKA